ncbi:hypothetical protein RKD28_003174 [Streptomyces sp. SAI-229]
MNRSRHTALSAGITALTLAFGVTALTEPAYSAEPSSNGNGATSEGVGRR